MGDNFSIKIEKHDLYSRCIIKGWVAIMSYKALLDAIDSIINEKIEKRKFLVFDMSLVTAINSICINAIYSRREKIGNSMWDFIIISPGGENGEIFSITGINLIYPVYPSFEAFITDRDIND